MDWTRSARHLCRVQFGVPRGTLRGIMPHRSSDDRFLLAGLTAGAAVRRPHRRPDGGAGTAGRGAGARRRLIPRRGSDDRGRAPRHSAGRDDLPVRSSRPTSSARGPTTAPARSSSRATARRSRRRCRRGPRRIGDRRSPRRPRRSPSVLPTFDEYAGPPIDFGRMEADELRSDGPAAIRHGRRHPQRRPGQRAEHAQHPRRAVGVVQGDVRRAALVRAAAGQLPERVRRVPEAARRARARRRARRASTAGIRISKAMPMYCVAFSFKDVYDTTDMRSTGGADVNYAMDAPPQDSTIVAELRAKGAIIYAKANLDEYNAGSGDPGGAAKVGRARTTAPARAARGAAPRATRTTPRARPAARAPDRPRRSAANLVQCSICEETGGSCRQPAWRNDVVALVTTKGLMPYGGAIGADPYLDRAGIQCRTVKDAALRARRAEGSQARLLRSARHLHGAAEGADLGAAVRVVRRRPPAAPAASRSPACASASCASTWSSTRRTTRR